MLAYKFLSGGAVGLFSGRRWPVPSGGGPGAWVVADSIRACRVRDLPYWINDELWEAELADEVARAETLLFAGRARLLRRIDAWDARATGALADFCAWRSRDLAADLLERHGLSARAAELARCESLDALRDAASAVAAAADETASIAAGYAADVATYALDAVDTTSSATPAAWAGCAAYVTALAARQTGGEEAGAAERRRQADWLAGRLGLADRG